MKKLLSLLAFFPALLWAQNTPAGFVVSGKINGLPDGDVRIITMQEDHRTLASGASAGGTFTIKGAVPEPGLYLMMLSGQQQPHPIFLENKAITVSGDSRDLKNLSIEGSPSHKEYAEFTRASGPTMDALNALATTIQKESNEKKREGMIGQYNTLVVQIDNYVSAFVAAHPASYVSAYLLVNFGSANPDPASTETRYNSLNPSIRNSLVGQALSQMIAYNKVGAVGTEAIDFTQNDVDGRPVSLSSFKGKYVLVDFWASWCRPCRAENPNVVKAYNKFKTKNFTILSVSLDQQKEAWVKAIQNDHLSWNHVSDLQQWNNSVAQLYHIQSIPGNFLIDPTGKIIAKDLRGEDLENKLCQLLGCN